MTEPDTNSTAIADIEAAVKAALADEYRVERILGRGGMSVVLLAEEIALKRPVALKVFPLSLALDESSTNRFRQEAQIAASLDHPHVAPIHRFGVEPGFLWYSMKYIRGSSLAETLHDLGRLGLHSTLSLIEQAASALDYAHAHGIIHRDMKPANVMLDENSWAYVCDFGVAKALGNTKLTQTGGTIGTPLYMSPEQLYGRELDGRADQYSLAVMTFELLAGRHPFRADSVAEIIRLQCTEPPPLLSELREDLPERVVDGIDQALSKDPDDRFQSVIDFLSAIGGRRPPQAPERRLSSPLTEAVTERLDATPVTARRRASAPRALGWVKLTLGATVIAVGGWAVGSVTSNTASANDAAPTAVTVPEPGHLWVSADPWGELYIDGTFVGNTPALRLTLGPGTHVVRIERDGYVPVERRFELASGQEIRLTGIELQREP
jgi:serine/threonine-protein kinase